MHRPLLIISLSAAVLAVVAIVVLRLYARQSAMAEQQRRYAIFTQFGALPRVDRLADEHLSVRIFNDDTVLLNGNATVTVALSRDDTFATVMLCTSNPSDRLGLKMHITAPTFDSTPALDESVFPLPVDWETFAWVLTAHQVGTQTFHIRGIAYCASHSGKIRSRATVVNALRAIEVQPFALSTDNWINLATALLSVIGSGGLLTLVARAFVRGSSKGGEQ